MTPSSSKPLLERGLDSMLLVYALVEGHPASTACEQFIRDRAGWFTTATTLLETKAVLTKVYGVDAELVTRKLTQVASGPLVVVPASTSFRRSRFREISAGRLRSGRPFTCLAKGFRGSWVAFTNGFARKKHQSPSVSGLSLEAIATCLDVVRASAPLKN